MHINENNNSATPSKILLKVFELSRITFVVFKTKNSAYKRYFKKNNCLIEKDLCNHD